MFVIGLAILCFYCLVAAWLSIPAQSIAWKDFKTCPQNDQLYVEWDVKLFSLTQHVMLCYIVICFSGGSSCQINTTASLTSTSEFDIFYPITV